MRGEPLALLCAEQPEGRNRAAEKKKIKDKHKPSPPYVGQAQFQLLL